VRGDKNITIVGSKNINIDSKQLSKNDVPDVKVECAIGLADWGPDLFNPGRNRVDTIMNLVAKNFDERPVTISTVGIEVENGESLLIREFGPIDSLPKRIQYGETATVVKGLKELADDLRNRTPTCIWFRDALGHTYKSDEKHTQLLIKWIRSKSAE